MTPTTYIKTFLDTKVFVRSLVVKMHSIEIKQSISKTFVVVPATSEDNILSWICSIWNFIALLYL